MKKKILGAMIAIIVCELVGGIGSLFTSPAIPGWYAGLIKPTLNPPNWIFAPVWSTLFALMGVAAFLVWQERRRSQWARPALLVFVLQLALNTLWSVFFFGAHDPLLAFIDIIALWLAIVATIVIFAKVSRAAAWLLAPYIAWVSFAMYLNYSIVMLN